MKKLFIIATIAIFSTAAFAQDKEKKKEMEKLGYALYAHKKVFNGKDWSMAKLTVIYKLTTASTAFQNAKKGEVKSSTKTGAYAQLDGFRSDIELITLNSGFDSLDGFL